MQENFRKGFRLRTDRGILSALASCSCRMKLLHREGGGECAELINVVSMYISGEFAGGGRGEVGGELGKSQDPGCVFPLK